MVSENTILELEELFREVEASYDHETKKYTMEQMLQNAAALKKLIKYLDDCCGVPSNTPPDSGITLKTSILHDYLIKLYHKCVELEALSRELNNKFLLFVMGAGKNGKSTLVNALLGLGQEITKTGILPQTWKIDIYSDAANLPEGLVQVYYKDGDCKSMSMEAATSLIKEEEEKNEASKRDIVQRIKQYRREGHSLEEQEQMQAKLIKYDLYTSSITEVVWPVSHSEVLKDYRMVDTPGLKQELNSDVILSSAKDYYGKADGVIWLLPCDKISGASDYKEIQELLGHYGSSTNNMVAVINKFDIALNKGLGDEILREARKQYGNIFQTFIPVSAKYACDALKVLKNPAASPNERKEAEKLYELSGIPQLIKHLRRVFYANALELQLASKETAIENVYGEIRALVDQLRNTLVASKGKYDKLKSMWEQELKDALYQGKNRLTRLKEKECSRIYYAVNAEEDRLWDMEDAERNNYIKTYLIRPSHVEQILKDTINESAKNLGDLQKEYAKKSAFAEFPDLPVSALVRYDGAGNRIENNSLDNITDDGDAQALVGGALAIGAAALLGPVGLLFAGFAATDMGKSFAKFLSRTFGKSIAQKTKERFSEQMDKVIADIDVQYNKLGKDATQTIEKIRVNTYANLYGSVYHHSSILKGLENISTQTKAELKSLELQDILFK